MEDHDLELDRRIDEQVEHLNATRGWPWQQEGVESSGLDARGRVRHYRATGVGFADLGAARD